MKANDLIPGRYYNCGSGMPLPFQAIARVPARGYRSKGTVMRAVFASPGGSTYTTTLGQVSETSDQEAAARRFKSRADQIARRIAGQERVDALDADTFLAEMENVQQRLEDQRSRVRAAQLALSVLEEEWRPYDNRHRTEQAQQRRAAREMEASLPPSSPTGDPIV